MTERRSHAASAFGGACPVDGPSSLAEDRETARAARFARPFMRRHAYRGSLTAKRHRVSTVRLVLSMLRICRKAQSMFAHGAVVLCFANASSYLAVIAQASRTPTASLHHWARSAFRRDHLGPFSLHCQSS